MIHNFSCHHNFFFFFHNLIWVTVWGSNHKRNNTVHTMDWDLIAEAKGSTPPMHCNGHRRPCIKEKYFMTTYQSTNQTLNCTHSQSGKTLQKIVSNKRNYFLLSLFFSSSFLFSDILVNLVGGGFVIIGPYPV